MRVKPDSAAAVVLSIFLFVLAGCALKPKPKYISYPRKKSNGAGTEAAREMAATAPSNEAAEADPVRPEDAPARRIGEAGTYTLSASTLEWRLAEELLPFVRTPYKYGGESIHGIDCSGLTRAVYQNAFAVDLPHKAALQFRMGKIVARNKLMAGDLVFFYHKSKRRINHVGIYLSDDQFIHSMIGTGVVISNLNDEYWRKNYAGGRRYLLQKQQKP